MYDTVYKRVQIKFQFYKIHKHIDRYAWYFEFVDEAEQQK